MSGNGSSVLVAPERNNFFYGKLMDVGEFQKDYAYALQKRLLLNRFVVGSGVLFGLSISADSSNAGKVLLQPGAALDALGREIVVAKELSLDPFQPTDDRGKAVGDRLTNNDSVLIGLIYSEKRTDMVPKLVPDCSGAGKCDWNTVEEGYRVAVRQTNDPAPSAPSCGLSGEFPLPAAEALQRELSQRIGAIAVSDPADMFLALARVPLGNFEGIDDSVRPLVYGNRLLYELILCLAERLASVAQAPILTYVSGDGQTARANSNLTLVVKLVDSTGQGIRTLPDPAVRFQVTLGNGKVSPSTTGTDPDGTATTTWTLGSQVQQTVTASAFGSALTVSFNATAQ